MAFGERLQLLRRSSGLTQEQFAENHRRVCACVEKIVRGMNA